MPFKKQTQEDTVLGNVQQKTADLERQLKRINTLEVEIKRIGQIEKQLGLMKLKSNESKKDREINRIVQEAVRAELGAIRRSMKEELRAELEPIRRSMHEMSSRLYQTEKRLAETEKELQVCKDLLKGIVEGSKTREGTLEPDGGYAEQLQSGNSCVGEAYGSDSGEIGQKSSAEQAGMNNHRPIIIYHQFKVDKMYVDQFDQENSFRNLGIRELSGNLNIGTTFEKGMVPAEFLEEWEKVTQKLKEKKEKLNQSEEDEKKMDNKKGTDNEKETE
ncbi:hypothetical protein A8F94_09185 [Bacillus sp. FJAT-27225]|uniref:hypothetical protein n=1 Tax=Bacillus sp. FJAT-27225 TaxID=1743144 RepID=UPI00080C32B6|nr:hypothetical protein [Bacillus sp. FJAT-27225]OCA87991.1 hypothetical protein A8F94_09185 [Bacillus sp. FJAT-27225]